MRDLNSSIFSALLVFLFLVRPLYSDASLCGAASKGDCGDPGKEDLPKTMKGGMTRQKLESSKAAVDVRDIIPFFEMFLAQPSYSVEAAMQLLGDRQDIVDDRIILRPRSQGIERVQLECLEQPERPFLAGISVDFGRSYAIRASFAELTAKYGEPKHVPLPPPRVMPGGRYKPDHSYQFNAKGKRLEGYLVVTVDGVRHDDPNSVISVIYRRFPH